MDYKMKFPVRTTSFSKVWLSLNYRFDKVSLSVASCQKADSTVSVHMSKELELKGLKTTKFKGMEQNKNIH